MLCASPICRRLLRHLVALADMRALARAGRSTAMRIAMIPITTSSSTSVKALRRLRFITHLSYARDGRSIVSAAAPHERHRGQADQREAGRPGDGGAERGPVTGCGEIGRA